LVEAVGVVAVVVVAVLDVTVASEYSDQPRGPAWHRPAAPPIVYVTAAMNIAASPCSLSEPIHAEVGRVLIAPLKVVAVLHADLTEH
jgi:hypothetical protein